MSLLRDKGKRGYGTDLEACLGEGGGDFFGGEVEVGDSSKPVVRYFHRCDVFEQGVSAVVRQYLLMMGRRIANAVMNIITKVPFVCFLVKPK